MTDNRADTAAGGQPPDDAETAAPTGGQVSTPEAGAASDASTGSDRTRPRYAPPARERFDWRGWVLVSIVVVSFLLVPGAILLLPHAQSFVEWLGLPLRAAYLGLPMIPALLLGATAVWAAVRSRSSGE